ncbi:FmdB family zinc ribbon protein [Pseudonocardia alni]|uniref:FmdB family regulatory protein n=1 Tax=Pseudonocardia alni TaxID=33907 RepID=A0AA44ZPC0_PSEA5|nr:zinc ribbon domain-containing protein [Pseudonocardia alni]OJG05346.1 Zinc ribbon domain protein [Pseudonocardia autotrophica]PKB30786.1 putative FmdB family regulatory protein [Pseudonocardia alni]
MPIYVFRCGCGARFEHLASMSDAATPPCPLCGDGATTKVPAGFALGGQASPGLSKDEMPQTWRGVYNGNSEYIDSMRRTWDQRRRLEEKYPEIAGDQRPILAHEGKYHDAPLRAGDIQLGGTAPMPGAGVAAKHGHGHGHGHGHTPTPAPGPKPPAAD